MAVCYRHTSRETGVSCSNCGRPICPDCMTATPVGMRCPECSKHKTQVRRLQTGSERPAVTVAIIAICVLVYFGMSSSRDPLLDDKFALLGIAVADGEWWRLITSGFMHGGLLHLGFNMYILWFLGNLLEPSLGPWRFGALYFASLLSGSFGALLMTSPTTYTVGASGAVFGLMGAAFVLSRARGIDPMQSGIGPMILLNLGITFVIPGISIGGHLGGLVGGSIAAFLMDRVGDRRRGVLLPIAICVVVGAISAAGAMTVAG
jgi:membrane associated rhomboid family serine protease